MSLSVVLIPVVLVALLLGVVLILVPQRRVLVSVNEQDFPRLSRLRDVNNTARIVGLLVGIAAITILSVIPPGRVGLGIILAPAIFAVTQILATLTAGVLTHDAARTMGTAGLEVRRIGKYLPARLSLLVASTTMILAVAMTWTTAMGVPDDMGRAGRAFSYSFDEFTVTIGPWPGSFYTIPMAVVLGFALVIAGITIGVTVRRPRNASDPEILRVDELVRARAVESVIAALGVAMAGSLFCVSFLVALLAIPQNSVPTLLRLAGWGAVVLEFAAMALTIWCVVLLLLPGAGTRFHTVRGIAVKKSGAAS